MRILLYGINYFPEEVGIAKYSTEMCEWFAARGHQVEVITAMPSYPYWKVMEGYRGAGWHSKKANGVLVRRCPLYVPRKVTGLSRIIFELSFALSSSFYWAFALFKRYDVIMCICPPLQTALPAVIHKIFHRSQLVYHVQDLQMDAAKDLGLIRNTTILKLISSFERLLMRKSDYVSTISEGMKVRILAKGIPAEKMFMLPNWTDTQLFPPHQNRGERRALFGRDETRELILYSGNIGAKQGLGMLVDVAQSLQESHKHVLFVIVGDGADKNNLQTAIESRKLTNVVMLPLQPAELVPAMLNMARLHLVLQKREAADLVMPSKLTSILAVGGVPIVTAAQGTTLYKVVDENKIGLLVDPENFEALRDTIISALEKDLTELKLNARKYAEENLDRDAILKRFEDFLHSVTSRSTQ